MTPKRREQNRYLMSVWDKAWAELEAELLRLGLIKEVEDGKGN